jgi:hypothetical protein
MNRRGLFRALVAFPAAALLPRIERLAGHQRVEIHHGMLTITLPPADAFPVGTYLNVQIIKTGPEGWLVWPQGHSMEPKA